MFNDYNKNANDNGAFKRLFASLAIFDFGVIVQLFNTNRRLKRHFNHFIKRCLPFLSCCFFSC